VLAAKWNMNTQLHILAWSNWQDEPMFCLRHDCSTKMSFAPGAYSLTLSYAHLSVRRKSVSPCKICNRDQGLGNIASTAQHSFGSSPPTQLAQQNERARRETRLLRPRERVPEDLGGQRSEAVSGSLTAYRQDGNCQSPDGLKQRHVRVGLHGSNSLIMGELAPIGPRWVL